MKSIGGNPAKQAKIANSGSKLNVAIRSILPVLSITVVTAGFAAFPAVAQDAAAAPKARYEEAETYRTGDGVSVDLAKARALHEALVAEGYAPSLVRLGDVYEQLGLFREAVDTFTKASAAGSEYAKVRLAVGNLQSRFGPLSDPASGFAQLRDIVAQSRNELAALDLADAYAEGLGTPADIGKALEIYKRLSTRGYALADARLGEIYASGAAVTQDLDLAIAHFSRAVEAGNDAARIGLSKALIEAGRGEEALPVIDAAVAKGTRTAQALRAVWHFQGAFGARSDKDLGARETRKLAEAGDVYAARQALMAQESGKRHVPDLDLDKVLGNLQKSAAAGDRSAVIALARAYRELGSQIPDAREKHRALVETYGRALGEDYEAAERLESLYDPEHPAASRKAAYAYLATQSGKAFASGLMRLRAIKMSDFVYVVEMELKARGYDTGKPDGTFGKASLAAAQKFCRDVGIWETCQHGPITYDSSKAIAAALGRLREGG